MLLVMLIHIGVWSQEKPFPAVPTLALKDGGRLSTGARENVASFVENCAASIAAGAERIGRDAGKAASPAAPEFERAGREMGSTRV